MSSVVTRREVLHLSWGAALGAVLGLAAARAANASAPPLDWKAFLDLLRESAAMQHGSRWDAAAHVQRVAGWLGRLPLGDPTAFPAPELYGEPIGRWPQFDHYRKEADFEVDLVTFEAGDEIPTHDHPRMTGVSACVSGRVHVRSWDLIERSAEGPRSLVRDLGRVTLEPGRTSALTPETRNVHHLTADAPAQIVDVFTPPYGSPRVGKTTWYRIGSEPLEGRPGLFTAEPYQPE
jgi:hypothetical protein